VPCYNVSKERYVMATFEQQIKKALQFVTPKQFSRAAVGALKKGRPVWYEDAYSFAKSYFGLKRSKATFQDRMPFEKSNPIQRQNGGAVDPIFIKNSQFSFLSVPHKVTNARRKDGTFGKRRVLESVQIGPKFKRYQGVFIQKINGVDVPLRRSANGKIKSMNINLYNAEYNNSSNFDKASSKYSVSVMQDLSKRVIRAAYRRLNKKIKLKVNAN